MTAGEGPPLFWHCRHLWKKLVIQLCAESLQNYFFSETQCTVPGTENGVDTTW